MSIFRSTTGDNPYGNLVCPQCNTLLPSQSVFCSSCGKQIIKENNEERQKRIKKDDNKVNIQEQEIATMRLPSLAEIHLQRWQASQSSPNGGPSGQSRISNPLLSDTATPIPTEILQPLPTTPVPIVSYDQPRLNWLWLTIIIVSASAVGLVTFVIPETPFRPIVDMWFLFICPGMALVRLLRLKEPVVNWTLALTLSFVIDATVASIQLYAGRWSPTVTLAIVIGFSLCLAFVPFISVQYMQHLQYTTIRYVQHVVTVVSKRLHALILHATIFVPKPLRLYRVILQRRDILKTVSLLLLIGISLGSIGTGIGFAIVYQNSHTTNSIPVQAAKPTTHLSPTSTKEPTPLPTPTPSVSLAGSYNGTLHNIPIGTTTNISLIHIQQQQGHINGYFGTISQNMPFTGTITNAKHIQFVVKSDTGQATFSFDGMMQADGTISGTYCGTEGTTNKCSDYGLWSVSPGP